MNPTRSRFGLMLAVVATLAAAEGPRPQGSGWFNVRSFGAKGDGTTDDSKAVQAALDAARTAGGGVVFIPAGTYVVAPPGPFKGGVTLNSLTVGSNVWVRGEGLASVLKVKSGIGSYRALFSSHPTAASHVENVTISDLRFDQNCAASGGSVSEGKDGSDYMIFLAWGGKNLTIERAAFDPICGVNTISLNASTAENLVVRDSYFRFAKGPTTDPDGSYDNTAVYLHGRGTVATGNLFESTAADGARGAIELHGTGGLAASNVTRWYRSCVRVVGTSEPQEAPPASQNGFTVTGNLCVDANDAINVWSVSNHHVRGVTIAGNTITLSEIEHQARDKNLKAFVGISFVWDAVSGRLNGDIGDVVIEGNTIVAQRASGTYRTRDPLASGGIALMSAGNISNVIVRGNLVRDVPTKAIHVQSMGGRTRTKNVRVEGNLIVNPGNELPAGVLRTGIMLAGRLDDIEVAHNSIIGTMVPFQGRYAIHATAEAGSGRVGIHDNAWDTGDPDATYAYKATGAHVEAGVVGRVKALTVSPRADETITVDASQVRIWDVTITGSNNLTIEAPFNATPGQRLTVRLRNRHAGDTGRITWKGFKGGSWTGPKPGHQRVLEVQWDGTTWNQLYQSAQDVPD